MEVEVEDACIEQEQRDKEEATLSKSIIDYAFQKAPIELV
jgi:hypothetical protein